MNGQAGAGELETDGHRQDGTGEVPPEEEVGGLEGERAEASDEGAERSWEEWLDGRPHRMTRGKHYTGDPKAVVRRAKEAAAGFGKTAVNSLESQGKYEYLWIQFVEAEVEPGQPCPVCGGTRLEKVQKHFMRCSACRATLKAAKDWDVSAGEYFPPAAGERAEETVDQEPGDQGLRAGEIAELLGARVVSGDGEELLEPWVSQDFFLEFSVRFLEPVEWAVPRLRLSIGEDMAAIRVQPPRALQIPRPETVEARVRIPGHLLMPKTYTVELVVLLFPDISNPKRYERLIDSRALSFRVIKPPRGEPSRAMAFEELGSPLDWELATRPNEPAPP